MKGAQGYFLGARRNSAGHTDGTGRCGVHQNINNLLNTKKFCGVNFSGVFINFLELILTFNCQYLKQRLKT